MTNSAFDTYIVNGNITVFLGQHSTAFKNDVLNSSLLGSLASNLSSVAPDAWFYSYKRTLGSIFWATKADANHSPKVKSASILTLAELTLSRYLTTAQFGQLADCLAFVKNLPEDSEALAACLNNVQRKQPVDQTTSNKVRLLLTIVCENTMVISCSIMLNANPVDITILDEEIPLEKVAPQVDLWITYLGDDNYAGIRDKVIEKLGSNIKTKLFNLNATPL
jgi:hypothetical protein